MNRFQRPLQTGPEVGAAQVDVTAGELRHLQEKSCAGWYRDSREVTAIERGAAEVEVVTTPTVRLAEQMVHDHLNHSEPDLPLTSAARPRALMALRPRASGERFLQYMHARVFSSGQGLVRQT